MTSKIKIAAWIVVPVIIVVGILALVINFPSTDQSIIGSCTDTDGGMEFFEKGTATDAEASITDECIGNFLLEQFCDGDLISTTKIDCTSSDIDGVCKNGACVTTEKVCDGGEIECIDNQQRRQCKMDGSGWYFDDLEDGGFCPNNLPNCIDGLCFASTTCDNPSGEKDQYQCNDGLIYQCTSGSWTSVGFCSTEKGGFFCVKEGEVSSSNDNLCGKRCTEETQTCEDGTVVGQDPQNNCEFKQCPSNKLFLPILIGSLIVLAFIGIAILIVKQKKKK